MSKPVMTGFASAKELNAFKGKPKGFKLGKIHSDHGVNFPASLEDDRHLFVVAGSRAGKGTTMIIPNLIDWIGGTLCIDPKGENASICAARRGVLETAQAAGSSVSWSLGQQVAVLDPFNIVRGPARIFRVAYDPLKDVELDTDEEASQILAIAESIVIGETGNSAHFTDNAATILAGLIEAVLRREPPENRSISLCRAVMMRGIEEMTKYCNDIETPSGLAAEAVGILISVGDEEGGAFLSTLSRQLKWMSDPRVQDHLQPSDFSLVQAMRDNQSVFVCIPPGRIPAMKRWLRMIVRIALDAKMTSPFAHRGAQTLFVLDEFYALGHMQIIEDAAAYMAGYGIKLLPIIQNIGQVKKLYQANWETFLGNAGGIIAWGLNDLETEKYMSDRMGPVIDWERTYSESRTRQPGTQAASLSFSESTARQERAIRWPSEVHYQGARHTMRGFVISADGHPFTIERVAYMSRAGEGVFDSPDFIESWEANLPQELRERLG